MKKKNTLICSALSIATVLSMGIPTVAAEPTENSKAVILESSLYNDGATLTEGQIIDLGDGYTAVVKSVSEEVRQIARAYDTYAKDFDYLLDMYYGVHYQSTLRATGSIDYSPSDRWVHFNDQDVYVSTGEGTVTFKGITGRDTSVTTANYRYSYSTNRNVSIKATSNGSVSFYQN